MTISPISPTLNATVMRSGTREEKASLMPAGDRDTQHVETDRVAIEVQAWTAPASLPSLREQDRLGLSDWQVSEILSLRAVCVLD